MNRLKYYLFIILLILPPIIIIFFIRQYGVNIPVWDSAGTLPLLQKMHSGNLCFSDFWVQFNEHRPVFPVTIMLLLAKLTNWNLWYEYCFNYILAGLTLLLVYLLLRRTIALTAKSIIPYLLIIFSFLIFSPAQWETWIYSWNMVILMSVAATVGAVWSVTKWQGQLKGVLIAIGCSFVATYSFNNGLVAWLLVIFLLLTQTPRNWKHVVITLSAFIISVVLYYYNYTQPSTYPLIFSSLDKYWKSLILFTLAFLGAPLGCGKMLPSIIIGLVLIIIFCYGTIKLWRSDRTLFRQFLPWFALSCYSLISAFACSTFRLKREGLEYVMQSRYITVAHWLIIAVIIIVALWIEKYWGRIKSSLRFVFLALTTLFIIGGIILIVPSGRNFLSWLADRKEKMIACWENIESSGEPFSWHSPSATIKITKFYQQMVFVRMKKHQPKFNNFIIKPMDNNAGAIEMLYGANGFNNKVNRGDIIVVKGWAINPVENRPAQYVILVAHNEVIVRASVNMKRPDIEKRFDNPVFLQSGWQGQFSSSTLPKGASEISAYVVLGNGIDIIPLASNSECNTTIYVDE